MAGGCQSDLIGHALITSTLLCIFAAVPSQRLLLSSSKFLHDVHRIYQVINSYAPSAPEDLKSSVNMVQISRKWKWPKVLIGLMIVELLGTIAALSFFGLASPNTYRTALWQIGYDNGFNSNPNQVLYAYANYKPIPITPLVWSGFITQYNVVISVLSVFMLLVKVVLFVMHIWRPLLSTIVNLITVVLWLVSIYGQAGPDYSDPAYPSSVAWYITKSCSYASPSGNYGNCQQAKGAFATSVLMLATFFFNFVLGIWSTIPSKDEREERKTEAKERRLGESPVSEASGEKSWEMRTIPRTPTTATQPFTPRTLAFNTLNRQLPLRANR